MIGVICREPSVTLNVTFLKFVFVLTKLSVVSPILYVPTSVPVAIAFLPSAKSTSFSEYPEIEFPLSSLIDSTSKPSTFCKLPVYTLESVFPLIVTITGMAS